MPSQNNEDEILAGIIDRIGIEPGCFVEIGCHPHENNTSALEARGWRGVRFDRRGGEGIVEAEFTRENAARLVWEHIHGEWVLSIDVDGIDYWICERLVSRGDEPAIIVIEYNATKGPDEAYLMEYDESYRWAPGDTEFGASLKSLVYMLMDSGYSLVNANGVNAFFLSQQYIPRFFFQPLPERHIRQRTEETRIVLRPACTCEFCESDRSIRAALPPFRNIFEEQLAQKDRENHGQESEDYEDGGTTTGN